MLEETLRLLPPMELLSWQKDIGFVTSLRDTAPKTMFGRLSMAVSQQNTPMRIAGAFCPLSKKYIPSNLESLNMWTIVDKCDEMNLNELLISCSKLAMDLAWTILKLDYENTIVHLFRTFITICDWLMNSGPRSPFLDWSWKRKGKTYFGANKQVVNFNQFNFILDQKCVLPSPSSVL